MRPGPKLWLLFSLAAVTITYAADEPATKLEPTLQQEIEVRLKGDLETRIAAAAAPGALPAAQAAASPAALLQAVKNSYQGNTFERLIFAAITFQHADEGLSSALAALNTARTDKQVGASPDSGGTTSLATKGFAPRVLSLAIEQGAITRQVDKNVVTFRATPKGLIDSLRKVDPAQILGFAASPAGANKTAISPDWARLSFAVSFDTNRGGQQGVLLANRQQIASWGARYTLVNYRDANHRSYLAKWLDLSNKEADAYYNQVRAKVVALQMNHPAEIAAALAALDLKINAQYGPKNLKTENIDAVAATVKGWVGKQVLETVKALEKADPKFADESTLTSITGFFKGQTEIYQYVNRGWLATIDYTVTRDPAVADLSTITFIAENGLGKSRKTDWTLNIAGSFFNAKSTQSAERFHSFKATTQLDVPLSKFAGTGPWILSTAFRYQYIPENTVTPGSEILAASDATAQNGTSTPTVPTSGNTVVAVTPKGHVAVGQIKLTIPVKDSGVKIPFSFSIANRAGLIQEKTSLAATVGLTFDVDALFAKAAGKK